MPHDDEINAVIDAGADEIIVPMLTSTAQAERVLRRIDGACKVMLMIETRAAVAEIAQIADLPADRIYVGLNDLHIDRASNTIFAPLADGLLDTLHSHYQDRAFGFGGLTLPGLGAPLHGKHLYQEMARLECRFTFLRRSFYRDVAGLDFATSFKAIQAEMARYRKRSAAECQNDRVQAVQAVRALEGSSCAV